MGDVYAKHAALRHLHRQLPRIFLRFSLIRAGKGLVEQRDRVRVRIFPNHAYPSFLLQEPAGVRKGLVCRKMGEQPSERIDPRGSCRDRTTDKGKEYGQPQSAQIGCFSAAIRTAKQEKGLLRRHLHVVRHHIAAAHVPFYKCHIPHADDLNPARIGHLRQAHLVSGSLHSACMARHFPEKRDLSGIGNHRTDHKRLGKKHVGIGAPQGSRHLQDMRIDDGIGVDSRFIRFLGQANCWHRVRHAHFRKQRKECVLRGLVSAWIRLLREAFALQRQIFPADRPIALDPLCQRPHAGVFYQRFHIPAHHTESAVRRHVQPVCEQFLIRCCHSRKEQIRCLVPGFVVPAQKPLKRFRFRV